MCVVGKATHQKSVQLELTELLPRGWGELQLQWRGRCDTASIWCTQEKQQLAGTLRRQLIPKSSGGMRELGFQRCSTASCSAGVTSAATDVRPDILRAQPRFPAWTPSARCRASGAAVPQEGRHWVVDVDLEKFFDRVHHDVLMGKLENRIDDSRMLGLIRRYLIAGIMADGVVMERHEGTPQGRSRLGERAPGRSG